MENIKIRCRSCGKELDGYMNKTVTCGCPNLATIRENKISAVDLSQIVMISSCDKKEKSNFLTSEDLIFQEKRRQRKVRKLDFEIR